MFTTFGKGWLIGLAIMWALGLAPVQASERAEVLYEAQSDEPNLSAAAMRVGEEGERLVAKADTTKAKQNSAGKSNTDKAESSQTLPDSVPVVALGTDNATSGSEKIELNFKEKEQDLLTREAMEKLDIPIESLEFANADLHNVIRIIGERLNINFIFDAEDISGKVTLRLRNIRLRDALDSILTTRKLAIIADRSGIFRIVPQERVGRKLIETKTEVLPLKWISAQDVQKTMKAFLSDDGKMEFNEESNSVIVTDVPPQIETIRGLIKQIDLPERQVMIEARLVDINIEATRELGTKWSLTKINTDALNQTLNGGINPANILLEGIGVSNGEGSLAFGDKIGIFGNTYDLNAVFTALEKRNVVEVLANPRVTTLNNVPANIEIIQKIPYAQAQQSTAQNTAVPTIEFEKSGVKIQVKPIITLDGFVRLEIDLKQMINRGRVGKSESNPGLEPPIIDERNAKTNVIVKDNNTVVLGGLRQQDNVEGIQGVPWLHRVPLFGWLFKDKSYVRSKMELVLMMTPSIIQEHGPLKSKEKLLYDKIDAEWHLPDYFLDDTKSMDDQKIPKKKK